jgi:hypothetical protein
MKAGYWLIVVVLAFFAGMTVDGLVKGPTVRAELAANKELRAEADSAEHVVDSLGGRVAKTDTVRMTRWAGVRAAEKLVPPVCAPLVTKVELAAASDSGEISDLKKENATLRKEIVDLKAADDSALAAAKHASSGGLTLFRVFGLPVKIEPRLALGAALDAPTKPRAFVSLVSIGL